MALVVGIFPYLWSEILRNLDENHPVPLNHVIFLSPVLYLIIYLLILRPWITRHLSDIQAPASSTVSTIQNGVTFVFEIALCLAITVLLLFMLFVGLYYHPLG
jgi:hypothetical protein